ncbi:MAG TPA: ABC transporter permease subunit, partial [Planctomycetota bacterium]|nr:ABC transporter permease subunit [Planctomycetota bacterium]
MSRPGDTPWWIRNLVVLWALAFVGVLLVMPIANVLYEAFLKGPSAYVSAIVHPYTLHAMFLTGMIAAISVAVNTVFGVAAAWAIGKYDFRGKSLLLSLIDLPFSISPVISGLIFVLSLGAQSHLGQWLGSRQIQILYAFPGIALATVFVTFPFVAREVLPVMEAVGTDEEEAALTLGASPWQ